MSRQGPDTASSEVASDLCAADVLAVGLRPRARAARTSGGTSCMAKVSLLGIIPAFAAVSAIASAGNGYAAHHAPWTRVAVGAGCGAVFSALEVFVFQGAAATRQGWPRVLIVSG